MLLVFLNFYFIIFKFDKSIEHVIKINLGPNSSHVSGFSNNSIKKHLHGINHQATKTVGFPNIVYIESFFAVCFSAIKMCKSGNPMI